MKPSLDKISGGDLIVFNHKGEVWKGICRTRFSSSVWLEINRSLWMDVSDSEIVEVIKRESLTLPLNE